MCRKLDEVIKSSHLYQYNSRLALGGLQDYHSNSSFGTLARLHLLEKHQHAWDTFTWSSSKTHNITTARAWELAGGVLGICESDSTLRFLRLPSVYRGIEQEEWNLKLDKLETIEDFTFDPSQNLLVVLTKYTSG